MKENRQPARKSEFCKWCYCIKLVGVTFLAIFGLSACAKLNKDTATDVCEKLKEKYGCEFEAKRIGDRLNTGWAKLFVSPVDNVDLMFTATIDRETGIVSDDYLLQMIHYEVANAYEEELRSVGIESKVRSFVVSKETIIAEQSGKTPSEFMEEKGFDHYTLYMAVKDEGLTGKGLLDGVFAATQKLDLKCVLVGYVLSSENYEQCSAAIVENPEISTTSIEKYSPVSTFHMVIDRETCSVTEEELISLIGGR